jgi:hypothetical protein
MSTASLCGDETHEEPARPPVFQGWVGAADLRKDAACAAS